MEDKESDITETVDNDKDELEQLDPEGDVILDLDGKTRRRKFLVSSKVLSLASPVFKKLFAPRFLEGTILAESGRIEIPLHDDDPSALGTMLQILHFEVPKELDSASPEGVAMLAVCCDKYDCMKPVRPWIVNWLHQHPSMSTVQEYGFLLLVAHLCRSSKKFSYISAEAMKNLKPDSFDTWTTFEILNLLPGTLKHDMVKNIRMMQNRMHRSMQSIELSLRNSSKSYRTQGMVCMECGQTHPDSAKTCHSCNNTNLYSKVCNGEMRIAEYFAVLRKIELWPSVKPFETCSLTELESRISRANTESKHSCEAFHSCPLEGELDNLNRKISAILQDTKGLALYPDY